MIKIILIIFVLGVLAYGFFSWFIFIRDMINKAKNKKKNNNNGCDIL